MCFYDLILICGFLTGYASVSHGFVGYPGLQQNISSYKSTNKVCDGTEFPDSAQSINNEMVYKYLKATYENCTHIKGHLSIAGLKEKNETTNIKYDLSFFSSIVEVSGSVYIFGNEVSRIPLQNLRLIRGQAPFRSRGKDYSVYIAANRWVDKKPVYFDMRNLVSILKYNVYVGHNNGSCHTETTIDWKHILENPSQQIVVQKKNAIKCPVKETCNKTCPDINGKKYCWGPTASMCQKAWPCDRKSCMSNQARCFNTKKGASRCCHEECVGGCSGISRKDCYACRNFLNGQECRISCPKKEIYDKLLYQMVKNPDFRYTLGTLCVKECPKHYLIEGVSCVKKCSVSSYPVKNVCTKCTGSKCKKDVCRIAELAKEFFKLRPDMKADLERANELSRIPRSILLKLENCTIVDGDLIFNAASSRDGDQTIRVEDFNNLRNIKRLNGMLHLYLKDYPEIKTLHFLSNLEETRSQSTKAGFEIFLSQLEYLGLTKLKQLTVKKVVIMLNSKLCYMENFTARFPNSTAKFFLNRNNMNCKKEGKVCDPSCKPGKGCWGPGRGMCVECRLWKAGEICVTNCNEIAGFYSSGGSRGICKKCHNQCKKTCSGPEADKCIGGCKNVKDGPYCIEKCPVIKYKDANGICKDCAAECYVDDAELGYDRKVAACTGPSHRPGPGGCSACKIIKLDEKGRISQCVKSCPSVGFFETSILRPFLRHKENKNLKNKLRLGGKLCVPCPPMCKQCYGRSCDACWPQFYKFEGDRCVKDCNDQTYRSINSYGEKVCKPCSEECRKGCNGTASSDCFFCRRVKIYLDDKQLTFTCNGTCPVALKYTFNEADSGDTVCVATEPAAGRRSLMIGLIIGALLIIFIIVGGIIFMCVQRHRARLLINRDKLHAKYTRKLKEEGVALHTTDYTPNSGQLRIISAKRINKVSEIGSGAFGTVYKGSWNPEKEEHDELEITIEVAIKELKNTNDQTSTKEFLSEAHVMASVEHPFCMGLLGVCMSTHMQLISEFMPLGSLSSYLPKHKSSLGSQRLLTWAHQIAKGMAYLNSRGIVHRDLAARNVLLQNEEQVRITDFGLAKLLDPGGEEIHAAAGKFPVKWLAIESLLDRTFSHKSDVWSYGVTLWEMFTFGSRPYGDLRAGDMYEFLESGERLKQPQICTLDLYMLLIKCWLLEPESRPTFNELVAEISVMAGDPGRYLIIENDTLRRAPLRSDEAHPSESTSPRVSNLGEKDPAKGGTVVNLPPSPGLPAIESQLAKRRPPTSPGDHYSENPLTSDSLPPPPPPPPAPQATFEELDIGDVEEGDFEVDAEYLLPDANQTGDDYVPPSPRPTQPLFPKSKAPTVPDVEYVNQPPPRPNMVHNPNYDSHYFGGQEPNTSEDDYLAPDDDDYVAPSQNADQDDYLQPLMSGRAPRA